MIRLDASDFVEPRLSRLAAHTNLSADQFKEQFSSV